MTGAELGMAGGMMASDSSLSGTPGSQSKH